jgi:hypothetical protein
MRPILRVARLFPAVLPELIGAAVLQFGAWLV